ncbi:MAG: hypothetical protein BWY70_01172 [Bacteroidetes bacterium ADurb.Bin408]|nr:MAG: hypothetical protein BWY70_01172 [Bacteroidetes bacterium ADurb.Bin408]
MRWEVTVIQIFIFIQRVRVKSSGHRSIKAGDFIKSYFRTSKNYRKPVMCRRFIQCGNASFFKDSIEFIDAVAHQHSYSRDIERAGQGVFSRHSPIVRSVEIGRSVTSDLRGNIGYKTVGEYKAFVEHGSKEHGFKKASRTTACSDNVNLIAINHGVGFWNITYVS